MTTQFITRPDGTRIFARIDGPKNAPVVVFSNSLGTTLHLWDAVLALLPEGLRILRYDMRGHGRSDVPDAPYTMGQLVGDAEAVCDDLISKMRCSLVYPWAAWSPKVWPSNALI